MLRSVLQRRPALLFPCRAVAAAVRPATSLSIPGTPRVLDDITRLDKLEAEDSHSVTAIWESFHEAREGVAGVSIDPPEHASILERGSESPMFVFPIRREGGHFMLYSQYAPESSMFVFTYLEDYRANPEMAQPWASVHVFDELIASKGVGLLRAEVVPERLTKAEGLQLLLLIRRYYGTSSYDKVWTFNHFQARFDLDAYLASCP